MRSSPTARRLELHRIAGSTRTASQHPLSTLLPRRTRPVAHTRSARIALHRCSARSPTTLLLSTYCSSHVRRARGVMEATAPLRRQLTYVGELLDEAADLVTVIFDALLAAASPSTAVSNPSLHSSSPSPTPSHPPPHPPPHPNLTLSPSPSPTARRYRCARLDQTPPHAGLLRHPPPPHTPAHPSHTPPHPPLSPPSTLPCLSPLPRATRRPARWWASPPPPSCSPL